MQAFVSKALVRKTLVSLEMIAPGVWDFQFEAVHLNVASPWRITDQNGIRLGSCDHAQKFGLPSPVNAISNALEILRNRQIESVEISSISSDLHIHFYGDLLFDIFNYSSGYEGWNISSSDGQAIALGGGELAVFGKTS
jgi:hypothetical protein